MQAPRVPRVPGQPSQLGPELATRRLNSRTLAMIERIFFNPGTDHRAKEQMLGLPPCPSSGSSIYLNWWMVQQAALQSPAVSLLHGIRIASHRYEDTLRRECINELYRPLWYSWHLPCRRMLVLFLEMITLE